MGVLGSKFCTQRCVITWLEAHPDKMPKDAVRKKAVVTSATATPTKGTPSSTPSTKPSKEKAQDVPIPRALRNLHIDMAKPGTKLNLSSNSDSSSSSSSSPLESLIAATPERLVPIGGNTTIRPSIIESLANIISMQQQGNPLNPVTTITKVPNTKVVSVVKPTAAAPKVDTSKAAEEKGTSGQVENKAASGWSINKVSVDTTNKTSGQVEMAPAKAGRGSVKRLAATSLYTTPAKKQKVAATKSTSKSSEKSVSFNLNPALSAVESVAPVALDRIASYLQPKKSEPTRIKVPAGEIRRNGLLHGVKFSWSKLFKKTTKKFTPQKFSGVLQCTYIGA